MSGKADRAPAPMLPGVDTLRFVAAAMVAIAHGGAAPFTAWLAGMSGPPGRAVDLAFGQVSSGAAVAIFFILSGLCIHYPNVGRSRLDVPRFYTKRLVRIVPPLLIGMAVASLFGPANRAFFDLALWSIYSEIAYYVCYPLVFAACGARGIRPALLISCAVSAVMLAFRPDRIALWDFGLATWLYAAPLWLGGAWLAERIRAGREAPGGSVWVWRAAMAMTTLLDPLFRFHSPVLIGFPWTVIPIGIVGCLWIHVEIASAARRPMVRILEVMGLACYSSYLMHTVAIVFAREHLGVIAPVGSIVAILALSASFYLAFERPSHRLAQWLGRRVGGAPPRAIAAGGDSPI